MTDNGKHAEVTDDKLMYFLPLPFYFKYTRLMEGIYFFHEAFKGNMLRTLCFSRLND